MVKIMFYLNIFFIYSFLGFLFENILNIFLLSNFNSGILYGPWTFIYGIAIFIVMFIAKFLKKFKLKKVYEIILFYLISCFLMTLIEFSGGFLIEKLFHVVYWDYTNLTFNFGSYIALETTLFWGLFATLINYLVVKKINKLAVKIPKFMTIIFSILFIIDIIITFISK